MGAVTIAQAFELALQHHQAGRLQEAEQLYRQILVFQPRHADAMHLLGVIAHQAGRHDAAIDLIRHAITLNPHFPEAYINLGNVLSDGGRLDEAIDACRQAIALKPDYADAYVNLGNHLRDKGQLDAAVAACRSAIRLRPGSAEGHNNLGNALHDKGGLEEAIAAYRQAVSIKPGYAVAHSNLGNILRDDGQLDEAIAACRRAIELSPGTADAYDNLGNALCDKGCVDEAIDAFRRAIAINPGYAKVYSNLSNALKDKGDLDEAIAACRKAIALKPDLAKAHSNLVYALHLHPAYNAPAIAAELGRWNREHAEPLGKFIELHRNGRDPQRRLRVGYVSPDLRDHVVGCSLLPLLQQHDRQQFNITCYSQVPRPDAVTREFQKTADGWRNIVGLTDEQVAAQVRVDRIDLLVDLSLHTGGNRLLVFARKPAPVQVAYLGYLGSTGLSTMDYRLSDPYLDPPGTDLSAYSEKTLHLPRTYWCYQPRGPADEPAELPALENGFITFGCLNNFAKVSTAALDLWARVLAALPEARIIIHAPQGKHLAEVEARFERGGVERHRLRFVGKQPWADYVHTYSHIDIALDPFPHGGGITTCDALWLGVPVVSLSGQTAVGRGGRSILSNLGLQELVAFTPDQYVQIAMDLAGDCDKLSGLRRGLRSRMLASPLTDAKGLARDVEAAYRQMWQAWCEACPAAVV